MKSADDLDGGRFSLSPTSPAGMWRHSIPPVAPGATLCYLLRRLKLIRPEAHRDFVELEDRIEILETPKS